MSEAPASTGMGPDEPVGSSRSNQRNRNMFILGGLALVLVAGVILAGVIPTGDRAGTTASDPSPSASATVEETTCADGGACALGDIGPGGGLVFYNAGSAQSWGQYLEMATTTWSGGGSGDDTRWCNDVSNTLSGTFGTAIGTGAQNTALMDAGCTSGAGQSAANYAGGGFTDWFLPSKDELNAMYGYKKSIVDTATYGFASNYYWSSSQKSESRAWYQNVDNGNQDNFTKASRALRVRPVRAF